MKTDMLGVTMQFIHNNQVQKVHWIDFCAIGCSTVACDSEFLSE